MKLFRIIGRSIRDAFKSVFRNFSLSIASIMCATITLLVVAISVLIAVNINNATNELKKELSIVVYVEKNTVNDDIAIIEDAIKNIDGVVEVKFKSKDEWKLDMSEYSTDIATVLDTYNDNPLLDSFIITVDEAEKLEEVTNEIKEIEHIESANYGEDAVNNIVSAFDILEKGTIIFVVALIFVTAFLITNTIKLTIYSRREAIEIMRLVGASNFAIKLPFVFEGLIIGILGSIIPIIITIYGYIIAYNGLNGHVVTNLIKLIVPYNFVFYVSLIILGLGALIGMFGSTRAVRKYLKI